MPMAAVSAAPTLGSATGPMMQAMPTVSDVLAKDMTISWFRGEFAAANAVIDALCGHLAELQGGGGSEYEAVFTAIHRRRLKWIPVLQMQKYHSIADVTEELKKVADKKAVGGGGLDKEEVKTGGCLDVEKEKNAQKIMENREVGGEEEEEDSPVSDITNSGSQGVQRVEENIDICSNHDECDARASRIKLTKSFSSKEHVKGHMVNVVKGLKLYEEVFTDLELAKLSEVVTELRSAGHNGKLSGETFILFNKQIKGNKRELIQLGVPIFGPTISIEPIPALLQGVIKHLIQWQLIPEYKKPNGCIINFFDEGEYSQPFLKPPHLDQPISTLLLSESTMAFGRTLVSDSKGNYKGALQLSLKEGSLLVMRGNSSDMARHVMCPSPSKRVSITFFRVRPDTNQVHSRLTAPQASPMAIWQPSVPVPYEMSNEALNGYKAQDMMPKLGVIGGPVVMLTPVSPMVMNPEKLPRGGTGVFLPWTMRSRKPIKHLPSRA
ncbi:RNA demethylase ALKBH10B-like [Hibiscus syriacus]|uniref:RNA demethylase ALKBH10B-like n=1 Tax=Hibiscus syriacus TaxID=106335 RepID=UPI001920DC6E|nr:RNA demethylase ALKBH10B-like [Hibiscus syriacus]